MSPLYDVMPRPQLASERYLHLGVGSQGRLATLDNALSGYSRFGLDRHQAEAIVDRLWQVLRAWPARLEGYGLPGNEIGKIAPAFRAIDALRRKRD